AAMGSRTGIGASPPAVYPTLCRIVRRPCPAQWRRLCLAIRLKFRRAVMNKISTVNGSRVAFRDFHIPTETQGVELYVRNKRPANITNFPAERTIVMVHGATFS